MDTNTKQTYEDSNEETQQNETNKGYATDITNHSQKLHESGSNYRLKQNKMSSHYTSQSNQRDRNHSRSRSPNNTKNSKKWISSNAFINFVKDFRQNYVGTKSAKMLQIAGERWRQMSFEQKQPYVNAAMRVRNEKNLQKNRYINKLETNAESTKRESIPKQEKTTKKSERNKKESKKSTKNESNTESDTGSVTSATTCSVTSEDMSDSS